MPQWNQSVVCGLATDANEVERASYTNLNEAKILTHASAESQLGLGSFEVDSSPRLLHPAQPRKDRNTDLSFSLPSLYLIHVANIHPSHATPCVLNE
ncbi:unnamed protein product [Fusarium graminearum]|nr:unnamed protein product [Fusarium graminearum]CAG1999540.1 unnamed protein product [Fusarium graminearum]VTO91761.1 unnamed protein product [Fusarium graminearum]